MINVQKKVESDDRIDRHSLLLDQTSKARRTPEKFNFVCFLILNSFLIKFLIQRNCEKVIKTTRKCIIVAGSA